MQKKLKINKNQPITTRAGGQEHRKYHRLSQFAPDQNFIINYLAQRNFTNALQGFNKDLSIFYSKNHIKVENHSSIKQQELLLNYLHKNLNDVQMKPLLTIFQQFLSKLTQTEVVLKIELFFYIWLSTSDVNQTGKNQLKKIIQQKGTKLSENQELLKYFVLPYLSKSDIQHHPMLKQIYSSQWKQMLIRLIKEVQHQNTEKPKPTNNVLVKKQLYPQQQLDWFKFVKDLVKIATQLIQCIPEKLQKTVKVSYLIQNTHKYKQVLNNHQSFHDSLKSNEPSISNRIKQQKQQISKKNMSSLDGSSRCVEELQQLLKKQFDSKGQLKNFGLDNILIQSQLEIFKMEQIKDLNFVAIVNTLQRQTFKLSKQSNQQSSKLINIFWSLTKILSYSKPKVRQEFIQQLIQADIFMLKQKDSKQLHWILVLLGSQHMQLIRSFLQLFNKVCQFFYIREYFIKYYELGCTKEVVRSINSLLVRSFQEQDEQLNQTILSIYYKLSVRTKLCGLFNGLGIVKYIQKNIEKYASNKSYQSYVLLYSVALLVHILIKTTFFEQSDQIMTGKRLISLLIKILQAIGQFINNAKYGSLQQFQQISNLEEFSNAAIYSFVRILHYRNLTQSEIIKDIILKNIVSRNEQQYTRQATYILQKINSSQPQTIYDEIDNDEIDNDEGEQEIQDKQQFYSHLFQNKLKILKIIEQFKFSNVPKIVSQTEQQNLILQFKNELISNANTPIKNDKRNSSNKKPKNMSISDRTPQKKTKSGKKQKFPQHQQYVKDKYNWKKQAQIKMSYISA